MATILKGKNPRKPYTVRYWIADRQREKSFTTRHEASDFKIKVEHDVRARIFVDPDVKTTVNEYLDAWLAKHAVSEQTRRVYRSVYYNRVKPALGDRPLGKVTRTDVSNLLLVVMPQDVGPAAVRTARTLLVAMFGEALKSGKLTSNPAAGIRLPNGEAHRAQFTMATFAQLDVIAGKLPEGWALAIWLMRGCGLRLGEALAVRADSVRGDVLRVEEQVLFPSNKLGPLKSRKPGQYRDVPLPGYVAEKIAQHPVTEGYLFPAFASGKAHSDAFRAAFKRAAESAGLPKDYTPHDLRHTFASVSLAGGVPLFEVSRYLGHRSADFTAQVYGHLVPSAAGRARAALDAEYENWAATV
jgi:integrase